MRSNEHKCTARCDHQDFKVSAHISVDLLPGNTVTTTESSAEVETAMYTHSS